MVGSAAAPLNRQTIMDMYEFYNRLSDEPMTEREKQLLNEVWDKDADEFDWYMKQCTTKEGWSRLHAREMYQYHREERLAGID